MFTVFFGLRLFTDLASNFAQYDPQRPPRWMGALTKDHAAFEAKWRRTGTHMTITELERWLEHYGSAWVNRNPQAVTELFAEEATYFETPYDAPFVGRDAIREYWSAVPRSQQDIAFESTALAVVGTTGIARWEAAFTRVPSGQRVELDGVFILAFNRDGLCQELREWWHRREIGP